MSKDVTPYILGIDGGATASKAVALSEKGEILIRVKAEACNAVLRSEEEMTQIFAHVQKETLLTPNFELKGIALCLAGVIDETRRQKVLSAARKVWPSQALWIADDLISSLYGGLGHGEGIVAIAGTGASVYGKHKNKNVRAGGWGHILGDGGSAYYLSHKALRWMLAHYDRTGRVDGLGRSILKKAQLRSIAQLAAYVSNADKKSIAQLSSAVFEASKKGHKGAREIILESARALALNTSVVAHRLRISKQESFPICVVGGVFEKQESYLKAYKKALREFLPKSKPQKPLFDGGVGAAIWGWEQFHSKKFKLNAKTQKAALSKQYTLKEIEAQVDLSKIQTEEPNPRTKNLSKLSIADAFDLFLREDQRYLLSAIKKEKKNIVAAIKLISDCFKKGGRLFYVGSGTSGRLGVLDASECPPTFRSSPEMVQGLIAGGYEALHSAVEEAEDSVNEGHRALRAKNLNSHDVVVGISASGRTPFVEGALREAKAHGAKTIVLTCNPKIRKQYPIKVNVAVHLNSGPESLTGSTRLRAGTATKIVLNLFSTLSMIQLGKVWSNFMIDLKPTNMKLRARAIKIVSQLSGKSKQQSLDALQAHHWIIKEALQKLSAEK